jgi:hypothetical protein
MTIGPRPSWGEFVSGAKLQAARKKNKNNRFRSPTMSADHIASFAEDEDMDTVKEILALSPPPHPHLHMTPTMEALLNDAAIDEAGAIADGQEATPVPFEVLPTLADVLGEILCFV